MERQDNSAETFEPRTWDEKLLPMLRPWWGEILGAFLILFAVLNMLALPNFASAGYLRVTARFAQQLFGWGAYPFFFSLLIAGIQMTARHLTIRRDIPPRLIIALELLFFLALPVAHLAMEATYDDAFMGRASGLLGWALAVPLVMFLGSFLTLLLYSVAFIIAMAILFNWTLRDTIRWLVLIAGRLQRWADRLDIDPDEEVGRTFYRPVRETAQRAILRPKEKTNPLVAFKPNMPPLALLQAGNREGVSYAEIEQSAKVIAQTLKDFGLEGRVTKPQIGPTVTQFGIEPGYIVRHDANGEVIRRQKVRISQIANLRRDFALALAVPRLRIEAPVPGRGIVGIEVPNIEPRLVRLRDGLESAAFHALHTKPLAVALGESVAGQAIAINIAKMPHILIAGTTGSGKSVCMKALITSLIMHNSPETLRLILIDPKRVEMIRFNGLPHLLGSAEVEGERIIGVLRWIVGEMERRYEIFEQTSSRQLSIYNYKMKERGLKGLPHIVVFIDELADLMAQYGAETERTLCRLAQMSRATGIHLVVATQRPSTDVITGLIKANFPARIAFAVASSTDSRVVLDTSGAETLLGNGDMLFLGSDASMPVRVQGCFVDDDETDRVVDFWQAQYPNHDDIPPWQALLARLKVIDSSDDEIEQAIALCQKYDKVSTSLIQRKLRVGFPRAARIMEQLYALGVVEDPKTGGKTRKTYISDDEEDPLGDIIANQE